MDSQDWLGCAAYIVNGSQSELVTLHVSRHCSMLMREKDRKMRGALYSARTFGAASLRSLDADVVGVRGGGHASVG